MSKTKRSQGIAHPGLILGIVVVIAAVAFGGWYVWDKNKGDSNSNTQNNQSGQPSDPSEGGKYLVITEWGVRFPLPEELRGDVLLYISNTESSGTALFASKKLNELTGDNSCNLIQQPDGSYAGGIEASLSYINPTNYPAASLEYYKQQLDFIKTLGNHEYYSRKQTKSPPITCLTGQHEEFNDVEQSISNQLEEAFKNLETVE